MEVQFPPPTNRTNFPPDGMRRVRRHHLPDHEPVKQHPNTRQVLDRKSTRLNSSHG